MGDEASGTAIVADPQRDIQQYVADAKRFGLEIRHVFLTHFHADFVAVTADPPDAPPYFTYDAILNTRECATLDENLEQAPHPIELDEVVQLSEAGTQILDVRDAAEYAVDHRAGSRAYSRDREHYAEPSA